MQNYFREEKSEMKKILEFLIEGVQFPPVRGIMQISTEVRKENVIPG